MENIQLEPVETVMAELHCSRRKAYEHMKKMGKLPIGHGLVTRESLERYKREMMTRAAVPPPRPIAQRQRAKAAAPPPGKSSAAERYPRIRKVDV